MKKVRSLSSSRRSKKGTTAAAEDRQETETPKDDTLADSLADNHKKAEEGDIEEEDGAVEGGKKKNKQKKEEVEICTHRDPIERVPLPSEGCGEKSFTVLSWNVNGLRATVKNGLDVLRRMVETERPDLVCFQV